MRSSLLILCIAALLWPLAGCMDMTYDRIELGQGSREYDRALPAEHSRRTSVGLVAMKEDLGPRTDAVLINIATDRRVAGKWQVTYVEKMVWFEQRTGLRLRGEYDPRLAGITQAGPLDAVRTVYADLMRPTDDPFASEAHGWIAAGLVRMAERWPGFAIGADPTGAAADALGQIPAGGKIDIKVDEEGVFHFHYQVGVEP